MIYDFCFAFVSTFRCVSQRAVFRRKKLTEFSDKREPMLKAKQSVRYLSWRTPAPESVESYLRTLLTLPARPALPSYPTLPCRGEPHSQRSAWQHTTRSNIFYLPLGIVVTQGECGRTIISLSSNECLSAHFTFAISRSYKACERERRRGESCPGTRNIAALTADGITHRPPATC